MPPSVQLAIRYHRVTVTIDDQVALTRVDQVFFNPNEYPVEGTYIFPLPKDAAVSSFNLWMDDQPVKGEILSAEEARRKYEEVVRSLKDPALLEYVDRGAVQARIFPISSQGERRISLEYTQALPAENGLVRYIYPLNTEKFSLWPLQEVSISVKITSHLPIRAVYSPSHAIDVNREGDHQVNAGYEAKDVRPDTDFALYYSLGEDEAFHLILFRDPEDQSDPDGFFLVLLAPKPGVSSDKVLVKDVILVLDHSGSMDGEKFLQAQDALRYVLKNLNSADRFDIIAFSTGMEMFASQMQPSSQVEEALSWVDRLSARGSTDINRALLEATALADRERPTYLIFLTDGLPTEGVVDSQKILDNLRASARDNVRLFTFGVGYDVDTLLLDSLAQDHHGTSSYVLPGENLDEVLSAFYSRISTPVLTDLKLDFGEIPTYDLYPSPLPDLFKGSQIVVVGRYRQSGTTTVTLSGKVNGEEQTFRYPEQVFTPSTPEVNQGAGVSIPRLWATRKIGYLLNQVRLKGPDQETIDQIVKLSIRYGIVTPYTSYLVTEPMPLGAAEQGRIAADQYNQLMTAPAPSVSGQQAVEKAAGQGAMADANAPVASVQEAQNMVRSVGSRTFVQNNGVWMDTTFDPERIKTVKVAFLSDDYFRLIESRPELSAAFALGDRVITVVNGIAYEVVDSEASIQPVNIPPTYTPEPTVEMSGGTRVPETSAAQVATKGLGPCLGGLLPLILVPSFGIMVRRYSR
jgi:Ca-activated chloride channel family protein